MTIIISTEQTPENIATVLSLLPEIPEKLQQVSTGLTDEQLRTPMADGERTFTENLAHIINCEARATDFIYQALMLKEPLMIKIHPERNLGKLWQLQQFEFSELLAYFTFRRKLLMSVLEGLKPAQWSRVVREEGKQRKESVYLMARGTALHELTHVEEMANRLPNIT